MLNRRKLQAALEHAVRQREGTEQHLEKFGGGSFPKKNDDATNEQPCTEVAFIIPYLRELSDPAQHARLLRPISRN